MSNIFALFKRAAKKVVERAPLVTEEMRLQGITWAKADDGWREVCDTCGGNCGQCGMTSRLGTGVAPSLDRIIKSGGWDKNPPYGLPRQQELS